MEEEERKKKKSPGVSARANQAQVVRAKLGTLWKKV